jgi:hypothetical protein
MTPLRVLRVSSLEPREGTAAVIEPGVNDRDAGRPSLIAFDALNLTPGDFVPTFGAAHLYQTSRSSARAAHSHYRSLPRMQVNPAIKNIRDFRFEDFELVGYDPHPSVKAATRSDLVS